MNADERREAHDDIIALAIDRVPQLTNVLHAGMALPPAEGWT